MAARDPINHHLLPRHTDFAFARLEHLLDAAPTCPMCRTAHWQVNDRLDVYREDGIVANLHLRCVTCGFIASFDAVRLGLVGPRGGLVSKAKMAVVYAEMNAAPPEVVPVIPPRALWWSWVSIDAFDRYQPELCAQYGGGDVAIGYLYLDADAGANVRLDAIARYRDGDLVRVGQVPKDVAILLRPGSYAWDALQPLAPPEREIPAGIDEYRRPDLDPLRALTGLDEHRAPGYPDDLRVVAVPPLELEDASPEALWVRLEGRAPDGQLVGLLLNSPTVAAFGLVAGQRVTFQFDPRRPEFLYFRAPGVAPRTTS
ncbi:MAG: hypothetical protein CVU56_16620 [Deltaproteobacteria bacterium HGW-Deltaproteobacteria-14]|jgi:Zn ribbon nucleic-acid-binding protein|nr:MAG: hypothetical protein CVU56_16620 [Deltaproteobacteria bacterium HGW-Deltaproteobacteria-14]